MSRCLKFDHMVTQARRVVVNAVIPRLRPAPRIVEAMADDLLLVLVALGGAVLDPEAAPPPADADVQFVNGQEELVTRVRVEYVDGVV